MNSMQFEVEKKFWLDDFQSVETNLAQMGVAIEETIHQIDKYFGHPARDFNQTDEALRLRCVGNDNFITYKGARIDSTTKTRRELELPLHDGTRHADDFQQLLTLLGFTPIMTVRKMRRKAYCEWMGRTVEISLDEIDQLGTFIELEMTSDLEHLEQTKDVLSSLATHLKLTRQERRSYLELLVHQLGPQRVVSQDTFPK